MKIIDSHLHAESLSWSNLQEMSMNGIEAAVCVPVCPWRGGVDTNTHLAMIKRLLYHETWRAGENNIRLFLGIGVIAVSVPIDLDRCFQEMEVFFKDPRVVAIGEIGFDPRSQTCRDLNKQEEIMLFQLKWAKEKNLPVIVHTPPDLSQVKIEVKEKYEKMDLMERSLNLVHKAGVSPDKVVLDHVDTAEWVKFALDNGCYAGITIQQWRGIGPEEAATWAEEFGPERIMLNTDTSTLRSDHLGVPKTVFSLKKRQVPTDKIQKMAFENAVKFYNLPI